MKISLENLDARGLLVDLDGATGERILVRSAAGLRGTVHQQGERLTLSEVGAESLALEALRVVLGELVLSSATGAAFEGLALSLDQSGAKLSLDATATSLVALDLEVAVGDVLVKGRVTLAGARLSVRDAEGSLSADRMNLSGFALRIGDVEAAADAWSGTAVAIRWGAAGFGMDARSMEGPAVRFATKDLRFSGTGMEVAALALDAKHVEIGHVGVAGGQLAIALRGAGTGAQPSAGPPAGAGAEAGAGARSPAFDWRLLDFLSGDIDVDVEVDLTVPIIGSRKATHRLRVPIEDGSIDYRELEKNLSALENALLDFSVREGALVLERVNPLFPARGHGKPVVAWDLDEPGLAAAEAHRVRLAVLPHARVVGSDDDAPKSQTAPPGSQTAPSKSAIALRKLALNRINVRLALAPVAEEVCSTGPVRATSIDTIIVQGSVVHHLGAPPIPGNILGEIGGAALAVAGLRLGTIALDASSIRVGNLSPIEVAFLGLEPTNVQLGLEAVGLDGIVVTL